MHRGIGRVARAGTSFGNKADWFSRLDRPAYHAVLIALESSTGTGPRRKVLVRSLMSHAELLIARHVGAPRDGTLWSVRA